MFRKGLLLILLLLVPIHVCAQDIPERPTTAGYVFDYEDVIDAEIEAEINEIARLLQAEGIMELMVVTVPTIGDLEPYEYGLKFFREWGIGDREKANGLLIYATTDMGPGNNVIRISTGYGMEGDYPDSMTNALIQEHMKESLKAGDYTQAFANVVDAIREIEGIEYTWQGEIMPLANEPEETEEYVAELGVFELIVSVIVVIALMIVALIILYKFFRKAQGKFFEMVDSKFKKDIRTKGYMRYAEKQERKRIEREMEEEKRRLEREQKKEEYAAMLAAGAITQSQYDEMMAKLLGVSTYGSYEAPYDDSSYSSSSSSDDYSYGSGDSGGGGSDDRF